MTDVVHVLVGPPTHGVVRWARDIACALDAPTVTVGHPRELTADRVAGAAAVHIHVTDRLFGPDAPTAATEFVAAVRRLGVEVGVTFHDIPQPSDGTGAFGRRAQAYRDMAAVTRGVIVSSRHERSLLDEMGWSAPPPEVIPLALTAPPAPGHDPTEGTAPEVAVFGYLYPGKGHAEVLDALDVLDPRFGLVAIGAVSPGHDDLVDGLRRRADHLGRRFRVTGFIDDDALTATLRAVAVPVAHHRHLSASGSIPTWIAAGRRPLVPRGRYIDELAHRSPGVVAVHPDSGDALREALCTAVFEPSTTWLAPDVDVRPSWDDVVTMHRDVFARWATP
ncbi:glycosyltransferase family protein [Williamsia deligens]|uniref:Uncharacterized protein n=1 Tax=Williamsia deligens TaxID=321325 RepID=A0ABW3G878_9NOCA|nr:hypothetical protein [Williamsia deligens]MCP2192869.1 hypothetical protein [Williamsia deligens]